MQALRFVILCGLMLGTLPAPAGARAAESATAQRFPLSPCFLEHWGAAGAPALRDFLQARALVLPPAAAVTLDRARGELVVVTEPAAIATTATWLRVLGYDGRPQQVQVKVRLCLGTFASLHELDTARVTPWDEREALAAVSFGLGETRKSVSIGTATERLDLTLSCTYASPDHPIALAWDGRLVRAREELTLAGSTVLFAGQVTALALPAVAADDGGPAPAAMLRLGVDPARPTAGQEDLPALAANGAPRGPLCLGVFRLDPRVFDNGRVHRRPRTLSVEGNGDDAGGEDEEPESALAPAEVARMNRYVTQFFAAMGVALPAGSVLHYERDLDVLLVHSTSDDLHRVQLICRELNESLITPVLTARVIRVTDADLDRALAARTVAPASISQLWRSGAQAGVSTLALCEAMCLGGPDREPQGRAGVRRDGQPRLDFEGRVQVASDRYSLAVSWRLRYGALDVAASALLWDGAAVAQRLPPAADVPTAPGSLWLLLRPRLLLSAREKQTFRLVEQPATATEAPPPLVAAPVVVGLPLTTGSRRAVVSRLDELLPVALRAAAPSLPAAEPVLVRLAGCPAAQAQEVGRFLRGPPDEKPAGSESESVGLGAFDGGFGGPPPSTPQEAPAPREKPAAGAALVTRSYSGSTWYLAVFMATPYERLHACLPGEAWQPNAHLDRRVTGNRYVRPATHRRGDDDDDAAGSRAGEPFTEPFFDPLEPGHGDDDDDDSSDWGFSYGLDVTESLRTVAGLEMPAGSRAWLSNRDGTLGLHSTLWDHERLAHCLDATGYPEGSYLLEIEDAGAPQSMSLVDGVLIRGEAFAVPVPSSGPFQFHGQVSFDGSPIQGLLKYRLEEPVAGGRRAAGLAQGSLPLAVGVPAEIPLPGPKPRPLGLRLSGLRQDGTRRPWPVLADTLAEQRAAQVAPFARALHECRLPALAVNGLAAEAALRRLIEAWEATPGAPPCNLAAVLEFGVGGPLPGDWPAQSLAEALARFCVERKLPLEVAGDVVFVGYGPVPSDRGWLLLSCPSERLPLLPYGKPAPDAPATIAQLRRLIYAEPIDFGPCDKAWYIPGLDCVYARGRLDVRLRLAGIVERALLPAPSGTQGK